MCGIAGIIFKTHPKQEEIDKFQNAVELMAHRGPDHFGRFNEKNLFLYHYRLSIIDLDERSHQPFTTAESSNQIVYNGEIYNFKDLVTRYTVAQTTHSDTEVLFRLLNEYGMAILKDLNGIFAFSFYNKKENTISLVRDRLGVKPLYYVNTEYFFAFASEAKVLMRQLEGLQLNFQALQEFLWYGSSISNQTLVESIKKLQPGSVLNFDLASGNVTYSNYWSVAHDIVAKPPVHYSYETSKIITRTLLERAVERQCISDVPVGAYLSGGIDSSAVVAIASRYTVGKLNTYSVSFDKNPNSELPLARLVATKYQTNHHEFEVNTNGLDSDLEELVFQYDEPFADAGAIPLHLMAQQNKDSTRVVLQGDGGDEVFAGYGRHLDLSELNRRKWGSLLLSRLSLSPNRRVAMKQRSWALNTTNDWERMARQVANYLPVIPTEIFHEEWKAVVANTNPFSTYKEVYKELEKLDPLQAMLYTDMQVILPHTYLEKVDKVNMFHSIEARVPLLDNDLVEHVMRLPSSFKLRRGLTKSYFREVVADLLPAEILNGRKNSFGTPMGEWLRTTLYTFVKGLFENARDEWGHFLDITFLIQLLELHKSRQKENSSLLWRSAVLIMWLNKYQSKVRLVK